MSRRELTASSAVLPSSATGAFIESSSTPRRIFRPAVVMNMFYTGLGIARSLGEHGVPVIGLSAHPRVYGNFTRYAKILRCPDSREEAAALLEFLIALGKRTGTRPVIFPTRDDDVIFLDRFRSELTPYFELAIAEHAPLEACLSKWETFLWAKRTGVPTPRCWLIEGADDLERCVEEAAFPCVLKPLASYQWRQGTNWELVGGRKAIAIASAKDLISEYASVSRADARTLLQEMIPGPDDSLTIVACYMDRHSRCVAAFNTQKLLQCPPGFGTGCIVRTVYRPELLEPTVRLLQAMQYQGVAEIEYKWDWRTSEYRLIEINPRLWDQHRLGATCGIDLAYIAYCDYAGVPLPAVTPKAPGTRWIAEDTLLTYLTRKLWRHDRNILAVLRLTRGERLYAIWSAKDPLPLFAYALVWLIPQFARAWLRRMGWIGKTSKAPVKADAVDGSRSERDKTYVQHYHSSFDSAPDDNNNRGCSTMAD